MTALSGCVGRSPAPLLLGVVRRSMARNARHYRKGWLFCCRRPWEASTRPRWSRCLLVASLSYIFFPPSVFAVACSWAAKPTPIEPRSRLVLEHARRLREVACPASQQRDGDPLFWQVQQAALRRPPREGRGIKRGGPHSGPRAGSSRERQSWHWS